MEAEPPWMLGRDGCRAAVDAARVHAVSAPLKRAAPLIPYSTFLVRLPEIYRIELRPRFDFKLPTLARPIKGTHEG